MQIDRKNIDVKQSCYDVRKLKYCGRSDRETIMFLFENGFRPMLILCLFRF